MIDYLILIQARLGSKRFPNKVMQTVGGVPMVKRVWQAAKRLESRFSAKVVVAWPERYQDLDENNVLERFRRLSNEFPSQWIIRLTSDCPLLDSKDIVAAIGKHCQMNGYYNNGMDGRDVQIFPSNWLRYEWFTDKEHIVKDKPNIGGCSVDTKSDLQIIRDYAR